MDGEKAVWSWGGAPLAPSQRRIDPRGWIAASLIGGMGFFALALWVCWRPIPGLAPPLGAWPSHAMHWLALACHAASSRLCAGMASDYASFWSRLAWPERLGVIVRGAFALVAACLPAILLARPMLLPRDGLIHLRGSRRFEGKRAASALARAIGGKGAGADSEIAPGVAYPSNLWVRGVLIVGGVGSGKSTILRRIIDWVVRSREPMILFDAKGEFTSGWKGPGIIAPWDARSLCWDIARDAGNILEMEAFAAAMVQQSSDPMWSSASRQILVGLMLRLRGLHGDEWGWAELRDSLRMPQPEMLDAMRTWHPIAARSLMKASVTSAGILINLAAFCAPIFHLASAWGSHPPERRVSIAAWARGRSRHRQLILQGHGAYGELAQAVAKGVLGVLASRVASSEMSDEGQGSHGNGKSPRKLWVIADEMSELDFPMRLYALGRSRGLRCVAAAQDLSQLEKVHGAPAVKALVSMVGTLIVGRAMQGESAELLCKAFGTREVERANVSTPQDGRAGSLSFSREEVALYKPSELSSLLGLSRDRKSVRLILFTGGSAFELDWPVFDMAMARPGSVPAPWLSRRPEPIAMDGAASGPSAAAGEPAAAGDEPPIPFGDASALDEPSDAVRRDEPARP